MHSHFRFRIFATCLLSGVPVWAAADTCNVEGEAATAFRRTCELQPASIHGQVALTDAPFCPFFVVATPAGFTLLELKSGREVYGEGDEVIGPLHSTGQQTVALPFWDAEMVVQIEEAKVSLKRAQSVYADRCFPPSVPEALSSAK